LITYIQGNKMQRTLILLCWLLGLGTAYSQAGYQPMYPLEIGVQVGTSHFLGDLGGQRGIGRPFLRDTDFGTLRPNFGVFARYNMGANFSARLDVNYLQLSGDDALAGSSDFSLENRGTDPSGAGIDGAWFRWYRNLHFRTRVFEASIGAEIIPYNFELGGGYYGYSVLSPYGFVGIGVFNFKPQARDENQVWRDLQPLRTEGQGFVEGRVPYALTQMNIPLGVGIKWTYNDTWALGLEVNHRLTFTDYIDDVSTDYVDPTIFEDNFDAETAAIATFMARRSTELDPGETYGYITAPNEQRGDPKDNDSYYSITLRFSYYLDPRGGGGAGRYGCPVW